MGHGLTAVDSPAHTWHWVGASVAGTSHRRSDQPCQDAHAVAEVDGTLVVAVADGAGSARKAELGSATATSFCVALLAQLVAEDELGVGTQTIEDAFVATRRRLARVASKRRTPLRDLATTLLVVVVTEGGLVAGQVGDGAVVVERGDGGLGVVGPTAKGEYLNETTFLTSRSWRRHATFSALEADDVSVVSVLTDGLQLLALDLQSGVPHAGFFGPLHQFAASAEDDGAARELEQFLGGERVCARTDDDTTIVVAARRPARG